MEIENQFECILQRRYTWYSTATAWAKSQTSSISYLSKLAAIEDTWVQPWLRRSHRRSGLTNNASSQHQHIAQQHAVLVGGITSHECILALSHIYTETSVLQFSSFIHRELARNWAWSFGSQQWQAHNNAFSEQHNGVSAGSDKTITSRTASLKMIRRIPVVIKILVGASVIFSWYLTGTRLTSLGRFPSSNFAEKKNDKKYRRLRWNQ